MYILIKEHADWSEYVVQSDFEVIVGSLNKERIGQYKKHNCEDIIEDESETNYEIIEIPII